MTRQQPVIGYDRRLELSWLDTVAGWAAAGMSEDEISAAFPTLLATIDQGKEARRKNGTVLSGIWLKYADGQAGFHQAAVDMFPTLQPNERVALHWGKCMATYPFFACVAQHVGRLLRLQGDVNASEVRRRVVEQYGDTERVRRSIRHVIQTFADWNAIVLSEKKTYLASSRRNVRAPELQSWLVEAYFHAGQGSSGSIDDIVSLPHFFPFTFERLTPAQLEAFNPRLEVIQQGLTMQMVILRRHDSG